MCAAAVDQVSHKAKPIRRDWISKTLAGISLGLTLGIAVSGVYSSLTAGMPLPIRGQLMMWMVAPIWLGVLGGVYFFASGLRAWLWLGGANALAFGIFFALRMAA
jgi:hypothetical protein